MRQPAACLALLLLVACGDDDGSVLDAGLDAGPDADVPTDGSVEDGGRDAGASDGGTDAGSGWPSAPTELSVPAGGVPSNVGAPILVETSGGFGVALHRATTAGEQAWVTVYDPGAEAWGTPRLLPGRDARLAASGDAAMVVYVSCRRAGCDNGDDLFAERFTETGGWEEAAQLDVLPSGSSLTGVDANILYPHVVGDGAGGFLAAWNHQSANLSLYREFTGGAWQDALGRMGPVTAPGYLFVGHGPRRYVGVQNSFGLPMNAVVDGVVQDGIVPSQNLQEAVAHVQGDRVFFATASRALLLEAAWNGSSYDWTEVPNARRRPQDHPHVAGDGTHVVAPFDWTSGSVGFRFQVEALVRHDQSGDGSGTYGWTAVDLRLPPGAEDHSVLSGTLSLPDGVLVLLWEGPGGDRSSTVVDWDLLGVRVGFDADDGILVSDPVTLGSTTGSLADVRELPIAAIREGDALLLAWGSPLRGGGYATATLDAGAAVAGVAPGTQMPLVAEGRDTSAPAVGGFGGPLLIHGDFSPSDAFVATLDAAGAAGPGFESTAPADWTTPGVSPLFTADGDGGATLVWGRAYLERAIAVVLDADASGALAAPEPVPASSGARGQVAAARGGAVAVASTYDLGGSALPDGLRLLHRDAAGTWSVSELIASTEDWLLTPRLVPFGAGFVALWQERTGAEGIVRAAIHTGSGGWGDPITLEDDALTQLDDGPSLALSANDDAVVATWVGATSDLRAAVLTDLDAGFGSPSALREETASTLQAVRATAGPTGHLVVFLEENGSEERTYRARVHAGGTWSAVTEPFGALTEADRSYSLAGDP
ncbi:MAG TPA: hypothetical protein RMG95_04700, partial [Polyangiaceae bacterium LLY-WYZ-15_(1-7)]|nr:hypothetical protein [Polyangiaceae bacterium LLY-WYZ-15_(1-7)]